MDIFEFLARHKFQILVVVAFFGIPWIWTFFKNMNLKKSSASFLEKNPNAAKVYLTSKSFIVSESVTVFTVNGEPPKFFSEKFKTGFYVLPGECEVEMMYSHSRPGFFYRNVSTTTDLVKKILVTEPYKTYKIGFNRNEERFIFDEIDDLN